VARVELEVGAGVTAERQSGGADARAHPIGAELTTALGTDDGPGNSAASLRIALRVGAHGRGSAARVVPNESRRAGRRAHTRRAVLARRADHAAAAAVAAVRREIDAGEPTDTLGRDAVGLDYAVALAACLPRWTSAVAGAAVRPIGGEDSLTAVRV
jgi:hypothetical protein